MDDKNRTITKNKILTAAKKIFTSRGFDGTSVDDIAKQAGVAKSLLYYYFESKDEIFYALLKSASENIVNRVVEDHKEVVINSRRQSLDYGISVLKDEIDVLRIAVSEALKTPDKTNILFQFPAIVFDELKYKYDFMPETKARICLNAIIIITYLSFKETICDAFNLDEAVIKDLFNDYFL